MAGHTFPDQDAVAQFDVDEALALGLDAAGFSKVVEDTKAKR